MIWELRQLTLFIHILLAITWVGGVFFIGWGVFPVVRKMAFVQQRQLLLALMQWSHKLLTAAGIGVIVTGLLLGTIFGPIENWNNIWKTSYGNIWITAFTTGSLTLLWGMFIGFRQAISVLSNVTLWEQADRGDKKTLYKALSKVAITESVEGVGFIVLIVLMVLL
ncbi:hypothetical protein FH966_16050 [Lentibacillus cibarius]|uniref:Copper resistance protein D domain-containing protein n=1 Tax=Lentibacillus cibarius TaxID=2583219 RepID=A0A549YMI9_9BACI|nr:hypothetical protein [Lentibacillus cibarius]TRM13103.1 hypothetical protein FH966_16050 [Lentibacillus cibarius]